MVRIVASALVLAATASVSWGVEFRSIGELPSGIKNPAAMLPLAPGIRGITEFDRIDFDNLKLGTVRSGQLSVELDGASTISLPGLPALPYIERSFLMPEGTTARVYFEDPQFEQSDDKVDLQVESQETYQWGPPETHWDFGPNQAKGRFFPGKFLTSYEADGQIHVAVFPVQYDRQTQKMVKVRSSGIRVLFEKLKAKAALRFQASKRGLIITSRNFEIGARLLQDYHRDSLALESEVVFTEDISSMYTMISESELPEGYKSRSLADRVIKPYDKATNTGYNYGLAREIIQFMRSRMQDSSSTKYVVLLGDAELVPPSYYFSVRSGQGARFGVTDTCYAATDLCLNPKLAVGRLPFNQLDQLIGYLGKLEAWSKHANSDPVSELALYGGKAFNGTFYIGELGTLRTINRPTANWRGVRKFHRTAGNYDKESILKLTGAERTSPFVYYLDHGNGNTWWVERENVSSKEILEQTKLGSQAPSFVASVSCINAGFDRELLKEQIFLDENNNGSTSIGESLLLSPNGAIAYLGAGRTALGQPVHKMDKYGNLTVTGSTYSLQILDTFYEKYHASMGGRAGDSLLQALQFYALGSGNDMKEVKHAYSYYNTVLLGDPAVLLPTRVIVEKNVPEASLTASFKESNFSGLPRWVIDPAYEGLVEFGIQVATSVVADLYKVDHYLGTEQVIRTDEIGESASLELDLNKEGAQGSYFYKLENREGVPLERRVWFQVSDF